MASSVLAVSKVRPARPAQHRVVYAVASIATAAMLWVSHFPLNFAPIAWIALVPWLILVRADIGWKSRYFLAWLGGYGFLLPALSWMRVAHDAMFYSWLGLSFYCSWFFPVAMLLLRWLDRRTALPLSVTTPLVWTAVDFARGTLMGGFPWYYLAHTQHDVLAVIQIADIGGAWAVTFTMAAVNGLIAELAMGWNRADLARNRMHYTVGVVCLILATLAYGLWRLRTNDFPPGPTLAILQTDLPQGDRLAAENAPNGLVPPSIEEQTFALSSRARELKPDLIVWPETTFEMDDVEFDSAVPNRIDLFREQQIARDLLDRRTRYVNTSVLYGLNTREYDARGHKYRYNTALLLAADGSRRGRYDKSHLVPFGEYVPMREEWPWLDNLTPYDQAHITLLTPGKQFTRFQLKTTDGREYSFGTVICYEDSYGELTREYVRPSVGKPVDFLVNITNDGWFFPTSEHEEHLAISRFRAIECRRPLVRSVNRGISAVIDGSGRVVALPRPTWAESKGVLEVVSAAIPIDDRASLYAVIGDWLPWSCWGLIVAFGCYGRRCARCA